MPEREESPAAMPEVDATIGRVENLYRTVTGQNPPPEGLHVPIPVEKDPGQHVQEQLDRLLSLLGQTTGIAPGPAPFHPLMNAVETDGEMLVKVDLPGVSREDLEIIVNGNEVTIRGRRHDENPPDARPRLLETPQGPFARRILVPPTLRADQPEAHLKDGILEIRFARRSPEELAPRTVTVQ